MNKRTIFFLSLFVLSFFGGGYIFSMEETGKQCEEEIVLVSKELTREIIEDEKLFFAFIEKIKNNPTQFFKIICGQEITDEHLEWLAFLDNIYELDLSSCVNACKSERKVIPESVRVLCFCHCGVKWAELNLNQLKYLEKIDASYSDIPFQCFKGIEGLRELNFSYCNRTIIVNSMAALPEKLKKLNLAGCKGICAPYCLPKDLKELNLSYSTIRASLYSKVSSFLKTLPSSIEKLNLEGLNDFHTCDLKACFDRLTNLKELNLSACVQVGDKELSLLPQSLVKVVLDCCSITDKGLKDFIEQHTNVKEISLVNCPHITSAGFMLLASSPTVRKVSLSLCDDMEEVIEKFLSSKKEFCFFVKKGNTIKKYIAQREGEKGSIEKLCRDVVLLIFNFLPLYDILKMQGTCREQQEISNYYLKTVIKTINEGRLFYIKFTNRVRDDRGNFFQFLAFGKKTPHALSIKISCPENMTWKDLRWFVNLKNIQELDLTKCKKIMNPCDGLGGNYQEILCLNNLKSLTICNCMGIPFNFPEKLRKLNIAFCLDKEYHFSDAHRFPLKELVCLKDLEELNIAGSTHDETKEALKNVSPYLKKLNLSFCKVESNTIDLDKFVDLKELDLSHTATQDELLERLPVSIEVLVLKGCPHITGKVLQALQRLEKLRVLDLSGKDNQLIKDEDLKMLPKHIKKLVLPHDITDKGLAFLVLQCPNLRELIIVKCKDITKDGLKHLAQLKKLRKLAIVLFLAKGKNLPVFPVLVELRQLFLVGYCEITDEELRYFKTFPKLRKITF